MSRALRFIFAGFASIVLACAWAAPAQAATADTVRIDAVLTPEGVLTVSSTTSLTAPLGIDTFTQEIPTRLDRDGTRYTFTVKDITLKADGHEVDFTTKETPGAQQISISPGSATEFVLSYTVEGTTTLIADDSVDFTYPLVSGMNIDVSKVSGSLTVPPGGVNYDCQAGVPEALQTCSTYTAGLHGSTTMEFTNNNTGMGQIVQPQIIFAKNAVTVTEQASPIWTLGRSLSPGLSQLGFTALALVLGGLGLYALWRRIRTAGHRGAPTMVAQFVKDADGKLTFEADPSSRPGVIGTLVDSRVDPADIVASILDLAVRGHLLITEVETSRYTAPDWTFTRREGPDDLKPYEVELLDALTSGEGKVSALTSSVAPVIDSVQDSLYQEVLNAGWFSRLPSQRSKLVPVAWVCLIVALAATVVLMAFTTFGLVGFALVALAVVLLAIGYQAPPISRQGAAVYAGLHALADDIDAHSGSEIDGPQMYDQISRLLPYAIVLGGSERWLGFLVEADEDPDPDSTDLSWYHAPDDWHLKYLPSSLDSFITTVTGRLFTRL